MNWNHVSRELELAIFGEDDETCDHPRESVQRIENNPYANAYCPRCDTNFHLSDFNQ